MSHYPRRSLPGTASPEPRTAPAFPKKATKRAPGGSLWPGDLLGAALRIPQAVLDAQAEHLRSIVGGELVVSVRSTADPRSGIATHRFVLAIRALEGYEFELLRLGHLLSRVYPCGMRCDTLGLNVSFEDERAIRDERALEATLENVFASDDVRQAVRSMYAQAIVEGERAKKKRGQRATDGGGTKG